MKTILLQPTEPTPEQVQELADLKAMRRDLEDQITALYVYHEPSGEWYNVETIIVYKELTFSRIPIVKELARVITKIMAIEAPDDKPPSAISVLLDIVQRIDEVILAYGEPTLTAYPRSGSVVRCLNRYKPGICGQVLQAQTDADVSTFTNHIRAICQDDSTSAELLLDWMAWIVQNPSLKIRWAPLIYSQQGIGKDTMLAPLIKILGEHNCTDISIEELETNFNNYDACKLIVLNEAKNRDRFDTYERLKPKISGTGSGMIKVNVKYERPYTVKNVSAWIVLTNHNNAMPLDAGDRRFYVIEGHLPCDDTPESKQKYFSRLWDWYADDQGYERLHTWFKSRDVSSFNPNQPPADTKAKEDMKYEATTDTARWLIDACESGVFKNRTVITLNEIKMAAGSFHIDIGNTRINSGMSLAGYVCLGRQPVASGRGGAKATYYAKKGTKWSPELRGIMLAEMLPAYRRELGWTEESNQTSNVTRFDRLRKGDNQ